MAVYKVPQDVEADDKLIGPFSFRQFIYLIVVAMSGAAAWGLAQLFIGLAILPLPIMLLFGALALPLRKDQPMEIYLAAIVSYYLKPHRRLWDPDGVDSLIEITVPKTIEVRRTKDISQVDAEQRLSYLANLVDSGGWAIRGAGATANSPMNSDVFMEAQGAEDILDTSNSISQSLDMMMEKRTAEIKEDAAERMHAPPAPEPTPAISPFASPSPTTAPFIPQAPTNLTATASPIYNPYPTDIQQTMIQPIGDPSHQYVAPVHDRPQPTPTPQPIIAPAPTPATTSSKPISPDIMNLANNPDLSIETIAHEAQRIHKKEDDMSEEVVISLR